MSTNPNTLFDAFAVPLQGINLIEASAGTGKTWSLCALYLRLLLEKSLGVEQILVVTYTKAATAELRERLRAALAATLAKLRGETLDDGLVDGVLRAWHTSAGACDDEHARQCLETALQHFDEAAIYTIHGFCQRALTDTPFASALPFAVTWVEDDEAELHRVTTDFWRACVIPAAQDPIVARYLALHGITPDQWLELLRYARGKPLLQWCWPEFVDAMADVSENVWARYAALFEQSRDSWSRERAIILAKLENSLDALNRNRYKPERIENARQVWQDFFDQGAACASWSDIQKLFCTSTLHDACKKNHQPPQHPFFEQADALAEAYQELERTGKAKYFALLRKFIDVAAERLAILKRDRRVFTFDDMLLNLYHALHGPQGATLAATMRRRFPAALIDEFQDTDPLQLALFSQIYPRTAQLETTLFWVGDPKQAIYSFRGADVYAYLQAKHVAQASYTLTHNQRSTPELIAACNTLFGINPRAFMVEGLHYQPVQRGSKPLPQFVDDGQTRGHLHVWLLPAPPDEAYVSRAEAQARAIAATSAEIARLLGDARRIVDRPNEFGPIDSSNVGANCFAQHVLPGVRLDDQALAPQHIAVLVRTHNEARLVKASLRQWGIDSVELAQDSVYQTAVASDAAYLLQAIANPGDSGRLRAALATEWIGYDAPRLATLDDATYANIVGVFLDYQVAWREHGLAALWQRLLQDYDVVARCLRRPDGERRLTDILHLGELLQHAARKHTRIEALLRWFAEARQGLHPDEAAQLRLESDEQLVRIVTIHKAKGLEFPIVFCPLLWDGQQRAPRTPLGGAIYHDIEQAWQAVFEVDPDDAAKKTMQREEAAEHLRLIYVALTRAVQRCYLVAGLYKSQKSLKAASKGLLNWLVAGSACEPDEWLNSDTERPEILSSWQALAQHPEIAVTPLPPLVTPQPLRDNNVTADLRMTPLPSRVPKISWQQSSFSQLAAQRALSARDDVENSADYDQWPATVIAATTHDYATTEPLLSPTRIAKTGEPASPSSDDILAFPQGSRAGQCIHAVFEHCDFTDTTTWPTAIERALRAHPQPGAELETLRAQLSNMLRDVLNTPLPSGFCLAQVPLSKRLTELEFYFPLQALNAKRLHDFLRRADYALPTLAFSTFSGYLQGFIDLLFEHEGRFYLIDWKSNALGRTPEDYAHTALQRAMIEHVYTLQYLLYTVAARRWLKRRLRRFDYEKHFGGIYYLFIRGVRPEWRQADGTPCGVFFDRPTTESIEEFERVLGKQA